VCRIGWSLFAHRRRNVLPLIAATACGGLAPATHAAPGDIHNLGTLGGHYSGGSGINASGQVVGYSSVGSTDSHAFRYDGIPGAGGLMRDLGLLPGSASSSASDVNASGQVAGSTHLSGGVTYHAFRYDGTPGVDGVMRDLGTFGGSYSGATGINASGQVAGYAYLAGNSIRRAFRYDGTPGIDGVMHNLGTLGGTISHGSAINDAGQVVGVSDINGGDRRAFRYDGTPGVDGLMRDLGILPGGNESQGNNINASGQVTGVANTTTGVFHAFRYVGTPGVDGVMQYLGSAGGPNRYSGGFDIHDTGIVVGYSQLASGASCAILWNADGSIVNLDAWLDSVNPTIGLPWTLAEAWGINGGGLITGIGTYNDGPGGLPDGQRAFLLDASSFVPEPSSVCVLGVGAFSLLRRRARALQA
jgi:probable HAF family extracellular repeat protein